MLALAGGHDAAIGEDDVGFEQVIDRQAVLARQIAGAAAKRESGDACRRDDPEGNGETECMRRMIDVAGCAATFDANGLRRRVHAHALHHRQIDHQPVVAAAEARAVVTAATNREQQALVASEVDGRDDVGHVDAARDQTRPLVDHAVVQGACSVVVGIARLNQSSAKILLKRCNRLFGHGGLREVRRSSTGMYRSGDIVAQTRQVARAKPLSVASLRARSDARRSSSTTGCSRQKRHQRVFTA